jgi:hypothetical protein
MDGHPVPYAAAVLFGLAVGITELVARYRDRPTAPLSTVSGWIYIVVNGLAAGLALWLIRAQGVAAKTTVFNPAVAQVLLAGFGTMAFFRTSLFTMRVGEADVPIGPAAVFQVILNAADRACDRSRAGPRSEGIVAIMRGVSFERAQKSLPLHCFALMQNVSMAEQQAVVQAIAGLSGTTGMSDEIKAFNMGLLLMNVVGEKVLRRAVAALGPLIAEPPKDDPPILSRAVSLQPAQTAGLLEFCMVLAPQRLRDRRVEDLARELASAAERVDGEAKRNVIRLAILRERFGGETVVQALGLLAACTAPVSPSAAPITGADIGPGPPAPSPEIRILGWGSLLWEADEADPEAHRGFTQQHLGWERQGPTLPLEFSRISERRQGALTLVIDQQHGQAVAVSSARSRRERIADAIADLMARESARREEDIGFVGLALRTHRGRDQAAVRTIEDWAREHHVAAVVWADFEPNFEALRKRPWSIAAALDYLRDLAEDGRAAAATYLDRAPEFVRTPLREAVEEAARRETAAIRAAETKPTRADDPD